MTNRRRNTLSSLDDEGWHPAGEVHNSKVGTIDDDDNLVLLLAITPTPTGIRHHTKMCLLISREEAGELKRRLKRMLSHGAESV